MPWGIVIASAVLLAITTGTRQSLGLFVRPLAATGLGIATISLILAIGQFFWGASQPVFGVLAERIGTYRVVVLGALLLAGGLAATPLLTGAGPLTMSLGVVSAIGGGAASFAILIGAVAQRVPSAHQAMAAAWINAGGSIGQLIFAPLAQAIITIAGWPVAMWSLAGAALLTILFARPAVALRGPELAAARTCGARADVRPGPSGIGQSQLLVPAPGLLHVRIPHRIPRDPPAGRNRPVRPRRLRGRHRAGGHRARKRRGTLAVGWLAGQHSMKMLLAGVYGLRVLAIGAYLIAPKTLLTLYVFSGVLGLTWLATVPLTAGLVGRLFGARYLATLFGLTLLSHQIGAFFGAWLGGIAVSLTGNYQWMWGLDMALATAAALATLPIREANSVPPVAIAAGG